MDLKEVKWCRSEALLISCSERENIGISARLQFLSSFTKPCQFWIALASFSLRWDGSFLSSHDITHHSTGFSSVFVRPCQFRQRSACIFIQNRPTLKTRSARKAMGNRLIKIQFQNRSPTLNLCEALFEYSFEFTDNLTLKKKSIAPCHAGNERWGCSGM